MFADLELAAPWAARGEAEHATPTQAARFLPSEPGVWPVKTCSSLPLRLSSCTRLPTNSATTIAPFPMIAQASGSSKGTAVRNTRRKAPSCAPETRRSTLCGVASCARRHAYGMPAPRAVNACAGQNNAHGPQYIAASCATVTEKTTRRLLSVSATHAHDTPLPNEEDV